MEMVIIYHKSCTDGFGAAYAAWKRFGDDATYIAMQYGDPIPEVKNSTVFLLDFSFQRGQFLEFRKNNDAIVLDHHITAQNNIGDLPNTYFDMNRSGAVIAWEYFHPKQPIPTALYYIQDQDLWQWKLPNSEEINAYIHTLYFSFDVFDKLCKEATISKRIIDIGRYILGYQQKEAAGVANRCENITIDNNLINFVNYGGSLVSKIGAILCGNNAIGVCWRIEKGKAIYSFRSKEGSGIDVGKFAAKFGGGGHKHASGLAMLVGNVPKELKFWELSNDRKI